MAFLESTDFDMDQFAYLKRRSTTQALLTVTEKVKKGLLGSKAGVLFFDFFRRLRERKQVPPFG